jgi:hypothetical protein
MSKQQQRRQSICQRRLSDHGGKTTNKKWVNTLSAAKHLPERGPNSQWQQSIRQGSTDGQASVREEVTPYGKASTEGSGHDTLSSKASANKRRPTITTAKHSPKEKMIAAKHPLQ